MRKEVLIIFFTIASVVSECMAQDISDQHRFWNQQSFSGEFKLSALYREEKSYYDLMKEDQQSKYFLGGIRLNSNSFLWSKDIADLNLSAEFNPESRKETYIQIPDRSEMRTYKNLDFRTTVFNNKPLTLNAFGGFNQNFYNRELLTNVRTTTTNWGGMLSVNNKVLPMTLSYRKSYWKQDELEAKRAFTMNQEDIEGRLTKSFGERNTNELIYSRNYYHYSYFGSGEIRNLINRATLTDNLYFDRNKKYSLNSFISLYDQKGSEKFRKIDVIERLFFQFNSNLRLTGDYNFYRMEQIQFLNQNRAVISLNHRLYESLTTRFYSEYSKVDQTYYDESNIKSGAEIFYTKKIGSGRINLGYRYFHHWFDARGVPSEIIVADEEQSLSDTKITLLKRPYVKAGSVKVTDLTGAIIYQEGMDYNLMTQDSYIMIQRVPGGKISNNQTVRVDYIAMIPGSYGYQANNNSFSANLQLFRKLVEIYYRGSWQHYSNLREADFVILNWYDQNAYGGQLDIGPATGGLEYESYKSNIIPYNRMRYFLNLNWNIFSVLLLSVNGNISDYKYIDDKIDQKYSNVSGRITWSLTPSVKADFEVGYLEQIGKNIDLRMITSHAEISSAIRQMLIKLRLNFYNRHYLNSNFQFFGTQIELIRRF